MTKRRAFVIPLIALVIMTALAALAPAAHADGGDFSLDFIAAGPFTYNHDTGVGGAYADRTISKTEGVVESLEGGDFACGDKVVYFTAITVNAGATGKQNIELDYGFLAEPTGQPGVGHALPISAEPNPNDSGMAGDWQDTTAAIVSNTAKIDTSGPQDEVVATVAVNHLDPGETFIVRVVLELSCIPDSDPTGNLQGAIHAARVVDPVEDTINVGDQTIPFKSLSEISQPASVSVDLGACEPSVGSSVTPLTVAITPSGAASVTVDGPNGFTHTFTGSGGSIDLAPGHYTWTATAGSGFVLGGKTSGSFDVADCSLVAASVNVTVGSCPATSSATKPVAVAINPDGGATVEISGPNGYHTTVTGSGATLNLAAGDYTWSAKERSGFSLIGAKSGSFSVGSCVVQVLPKTFLPKPLPKTGTPLPGVAAVGFAFLLLGVGMVSASRRTPGAAAATGRTSLVARLSGRTMWTAPEQRLVLDSFTLRDLLTSARTRCEGAIARRRDGHTGRAGPGDG
jgi:hypothetical protein